MTRSARGTTDKLGRKVRQKAGLNRAILDASMTEARRRITYKTSWYGSRLDRLAVLDRWWSSNKTCSTCGWQDPSLTLADRVFECAQCGLTLDRDLNAARNIEKHATQVAFGTGRPKTPVENPSDSPAPRRRSRARPCIDSGSWNCG
ncbi:transposase [Streptomyces sp. S5]|uniref:transposase n=1 Tax=Streptomyces sp. S5 TaxID=1456735 RepID=UPI001F09D8F7|nr:transposase [Streptomyces sp. S5]